MDLHELPGLDQDHSSRQPQWSEESAYSGFRDPLRGGPVALGVWPPTAFCPCGMIAHDDAHPECESCETFRCSRCERWCSWEMGHGDCSLCDDCCTYLGVHEEDAYDEEQVG